MSEARVPFAQPSVPAEAVAAALEPVLAAAQRLARPHSTVTARDAMARVWEALHMAHGELSALDVKAARQRFAEREPA